MNILGRHRGFSTSIFFVLFLAIFQSPNHAKGIEQVFDGVYEKNESLTAARVGKDVVITWNRDISNDISYFLYVGDFVIRANGKPLPKIPTGSNVGTFTDTSRTNAIYSLIYNPKKFESYNAAGRIFFEHRVQIDNSNQAVVLLKKTKKSFTYDYKIIVDRDGSRKGDFLRYACRASAWGLPLSKSVLSVSSLSLNLISYLPGGQVADLAGTTLDKFELAGKTTIMNGVEVAVGTVEYTAKAGQIDLWSKIKPKESLQLKFNGIKAKGVVKSYKLMPGTDKIFLKADIYFAKEDIVDLYKTISTARSEYRETNALCAMLN